MKRWVIGQIEGWRCDRDNRKADPLEFLCIVVVEHDNVGACLACLSRILQRSGE